MEKVILDVPTLWADHHVLRVREALFQLEGIQDVYASSAWRQVLVTYDGGKIDQTAVEKALAEAGYPVGEGEVPELAQPTRNRKDPQWEEALRMTATNRVDLEMSGEFRRY
ncbi:MAG: heavy-metal-associated domain-containing protein [Anaerolineae bacterium]|nr:heavy-metal-associated domain-containing protein [Anaerolineae bacterium]